MTKVVHVSSVHPANDVRILFRECSSLAAAGYDVTLIAKASEHVRRNGVEIMNVRKRHGGRLGRWIFTGRDTLVTAWRCGADVYHFHDPELMFAGGLLRLLGSKVIYDVHEDVPKQILSKAWIPRLLRKPLSLGVKVLEAFMARFVYSGIVAATPDIARRFPWGKTCEVQNFPALDELSTPSSALPISERPLTAVYVGGLTRVRGILELVRSMEEVETAGAQLVLLGAFPDKTFEQEVRKHRGWGRVDFAGWQDRAGVAAHLARARVGLVTLYPEPNYLSAYPIKMFEYMSVGLPLIASDFPLWRSIVERFHCGLLVDPQDPKAIARAIDWVFTHPREAERMGERGRQAVETTYNWANEEKKLISFYKHLMS
jgi:glycosyltransferase involved in cell wall biosynthesis